LAPEEGGLIGPVCQESGEMRSTAEIARSHGVDLRQHGKTLRGLCPLHERDGRNPSFTVWENGRWRCWSCGENGDCISLVMKLHRMTYPQALDYLGESISRPTKADRAKQARERAQRLKAEWRERDLAWTLGQLIRTGNKALRALTPENFDQYAGVVDAVATWTRWHGVFIDGDNADRAALVQDFADFEVFERGHLFAEDFNYQTWLSVALRAGQPDSNPEPRYDRNEWEIELPVKRTENSRPKASAVQG
jgi:hypothetical protein